MYDRLLRSAFSAIDADFRRETGIVCRTERRGELLRVTFPGRSWTLHMAPRGGDDTLRCYYATAHFCLALHEIATRPDPREEELLRAYLRALERSDARLAAAWPEDPAVGRLLREYVPLVAAADLPQERRRDFERFYRHIWHYEHLLRYLEKRYPAAAAPRLLEIGCGYGLFVDFLRRRGYRDVVGVDSDGVAAAVAAGRSLDVRVMDAAALAPRLERGSFDAAFAMGFFHHELAFRAPSARSDWVVRIFESVRAVLKAGGAFFCQAEFPLPRKRIVSAGFLPKDRLLQTKPFPRRDDPLATVRNDFFIFEKNAAGDTD